MKKKGFRAWIQKLCIMVAAMVTAFFLLNVIAYFYYFVPYNVPCETGETDFKLPAGFKGYDMREGFGKTQVDENGYNNSSVPKQVNVLCMGSSHTLGYNVFPNENYVAILNQKLQKKNGMCAYNIGMYGHEWYYSMKNLKAALKKYRPSDYVIIEGFYSKFDTEQLQKLNEGKYGRAGEVVSPKMEKLKKVPYFQIAMSQLKAMMSENQETVIPEKKKTDIEEYTKQLKIAVQNAKEIVDNYGVQLIFLYQPNIIVDKDGKAYADKEKKYFQIWKDICKEEQITMVDMTEDFLKAYQKQYVLPRGFENTEMGEGHLNRYGHRIISDALYRVLTSEEGKK